MMNIEPASRGSPAYDGFGRLLKAAGVPQWRVERMIAELLSENFAETRSAIIHEIKLQRKEQLSETRRIVQRTMLEYSRVWQERQTRRARMFVILIFAGLALIAIGAELFDAFSAVTSANIHCDHGVIKPIGVDGFREGAASYD